jgi:hypothetical protein
MSNELTKRTAGLQITSVDELARVADMMAKSGFFQDSREAAQAGVKILAGQGWGIQPFDAMTGIHIISGRPSIGAGLMAAKVKGSGRYDYRVREMTDKVCRIEFFEGGESIGESSFTLDEARKAGTKNLDKFARNMLFARAMSNGVRWYCPDVFTTPVYTPEELGAQVDGEGNVIDVPSRPARTETAPTTKRLEVEPIAEGDGVSFDDLTSDEPQEAEQGRLDVEPISGAQLKALHTIGTKLGVSSDQRDEFRAFIGDLVGRPLASSKDLTKQEAMTLLDHGVDELAAMLDVWSAERKAQVPA